MFLENLFLREGYTLWVAVRLSFDLLWYLLLLIVLVYLASERTSKVFTRLAVLKGFLLSLSILTVWVLGIWIVGLAFHNYYLWQLE